MAELGITASVDQIADVGLRLSIKLYTFGEIVASADRSVISISNDVSLTSGVLKELGQLLDKDRETRTFSEDAVQTADGVVNGKYTGEGDAEFGQRGGRDGKSGERTKRATVMLERLKWGYLQPKLQVAAKQSGQAEVDLVADVERHYLCQAGVCKVCLGYLWNDVLVVWIS